MPSSRLIRAASLGLAIACASPTAPSSPTALVSAAQVTAPSPPQTFNASASSGTVYVDGSIATPYWCYGFGAVARRRSGELVVTLYAGRSSEGCLAVGGWWNYRITVPGVPPGTWRITVRHAFPPSPETETVFEGSVSVPAEN